MPRFEKLTPEEARRYTPSSRQANLAPYIDYLSSLTPGEFGRIVLEENDKKPTIKNRLNRASERVGVTIQYRRATANSVVFQIVDQQAAHT